MKDRATRVEGNKGLKGRAIRVKGQGNKVEEQGNKG